MKLSKPDDDPDEPAEQTRGPTRDAVMTETKVDPGRDPIPLIDAVEEHNVRIRETEKLVEENVTGVEEVREENERLRQRVAELEGLVRLVRSDVAALFAVASKERVDGRLALDLGGEQWLPESVDAADPLGEFEE